MPRIRDNKLLALRRKTGQGRLLFNRQWLDWDTTSAEGIVAFWYIDHARGQYNQRHVAKWVVTCQSSFHLFRTKEDVFIFGQGGFIMLRIQ